MYNTCIMSYQEYHDSAYQVFSTGISDWVLKAGYQLKVPLPDRVGGHDDRRNATGGNQVGGGQKDSEHGINQGNQWTRYRDSVEKVWLSKHGVKFDESHVKSILSGKTNSNSDSDSESEDHHTPPNNTNHSQREDPIVSERNRQLKEAQKVAVKEVTRSDADQLIDLLHSSLHVSAFKSGSSTSQIHALVLKLAKQYNVKVDTTDHVKTLKNVAAKNHKLDETVKHIRF